MSNLPYESSPPQSVDITSAQPSGNTSPNSPHQEPNPAHAESGPDAQPRNATAEPDDNRRAPTSSQTNDRRGGDAGTPALSLPSSYRTYGSRHDSLPSFPPRIRRPRQRPGFPNRRDISLLAFAAALVVLMKAVEGGDVGVVVVVIAAMAASGLWMSDWV